MTFRPPPFTRWSNVVVLVALGAFMFFADVQMTITQGFDWLGSTFLVIGGLVCIAVAVLFWGMFIEVGDSTVTLGTFLIRRPFPRGEIVRTSARSQRTTYFMRLDGRAAFSMSGFVWGDKTVAAVTSYLGLPLTR